MYVADRGNARVQVFDIDDTFVRSFGEGVLTSPSSFACWGDSLVVAELNARLAIFDARDQLVEYVGDNSAVVSEPGWPNSLDSDDNVVRSHELRTERFNSPHAVAVGAGRFVVRGGVARRRPLHQAHTEDDSTMTTGRH